MVLTLAVIAGLVVASAAFAASATISSVTSISYGGVHVEGVAEAQATLEEWVYEVSPDQGQSWEPTNLSGLWQSGTSNTESANGDIEHLHSGTTYQLRLAVGSWHSATDNPEAISPQPYPEFTTLPLPGPSAEITGPADSVTATTAVVPIHVATNTPGSQPAESDVTWRFQCTPECPGAEGVVTAAEGEADVQAELRQLQPDQHYEATLFAGNAGGEVSDGPIFFDTTELPAPTVTIEQVTVFSGSTAQFVGHVNPNSPPVGDPEASEVHWHFACEPACPSAENDGQPPVPAGNGEVKVETEATGLEPNTEYHVRLIGKNAGEPVEAGPVVFRTDLVDPSIRTVPAFALAGGAEALVGAEINAHNSPTTYWIEYGPTSGYGSLAPLGADGDAGNAGESQVFAQRISGLSPSTVYHFRAFAKNATGTVVGGQDLSFETAPAEPEPQPSCTNAALRLEDNSTALPECRAYEQVSPPDKNGYDAVANADGTSTSLEPNVVAAEGGSGIFFESFGAFGDSEAASVENQYVTRRGDTGWATAGLTPPQHINHKSNGFTPVVGWISPDLSFAAIAGGQPPHLAPGDDPFAGNWYRLETSTRSYATLNPGAAGPFGHIGGGAADGSRVYFSTAEALTPEAVAAGVTQGVYEWHKGQLKLASLVPGPGGQEEPALSARQNYLAEPVQYQVSADGSRMVFGDVDNGGLYLREDGQRTVKVSVSRGGTTPESQATGLFQGASADDSKIFFTGGNLTPDATGSGSLYLYEPGSDTLTNLLATALPGSPQELGTQYVVGVSQNGGYVYFVSPTQFPSSEGLAEGNSLYVWHDGTVKFIAPADGLITATPTSAPARISPDGAKLTFTSTGRLTAYDNTDLVPAADASARLDTEVYVYDAGKERLTCVSCNPGGRRPAGSPAGGPPADSGLPVAPSKQYLNPQPGVRDDGSVFFESRDALVPQDVNGKMDVYLWKGGRVHLISSGGGADGSFLASSSAGGQDVFFLTRQRLLPSDRDESVDIYDARIGGGFPQAVEPARCEGIEACHGPAAGAPAVAKPGSSTFNSPSGRPDPRLQRLYKALKICKHKKTRKARVRCRAAAKRRYGKTSKGRAR